METLSTKNSRPAPGWAWLPIALLLVTMTALWVANLRTAYESRTLLLLINLVFSGLVSVFIGYLAGRSFLVSGQTGLVMLGCGALLWGFANLVAGALVNSGGNLTVTIHNLGVLAAGCCHLGALVWHRREPRPGRCLMVGYVGVLLVVAVIVWAALAGWTPVFFVQGQGGTPVRQVVLGTGVALFAVAAVLMLAIHWRQPSTFFYWYGLGLTALAVGLAGVWVQSVHGSLLGWTGRITQCLGGAYLFIAAMAASRETGTWNISLAAVEDAWSANDWLASLRHQTPSGWVWRYGAAVVAVAAAFGFRLAVTAWAGPGLAIYITFYPAVMAVALLAGFGPGLLATGLTGLVVGYWILPPAGQFAIDSPVDRLGLAIFTIMGLFMSVVAELYSRSRAKAAAYEREQALHWQAEQASAALRASEQRMQQALRVGHSFTFEWHPATDKVLRSASCETILGLTGDEAINDTGQHYFQSIHPADRDRFVQMLGKLTPANASYVVEYRVTRGDGSVVVLEEVGQTDFDAAGKLTRLVGVATDITARKQAEEAVARERDRLQDVMNGAKNSHLVYLDGDFNFVCVNETYAASCGYRPAEMIGKNHFALYPHAENEAIFARVRDTGEPVTYHDKPFEFPDQPERGVTYWDWTLTPVRAASGRVEGLIFSLFETTARKEAETALAAVHSRLQNIINNTPALVYILDLDERFVLVNTALAELLHTTPEQMLGKRRHEFMPQQDADWHEANDRQAIAAGKPVEFEESSQLNGRSIAWLTTKFPLRDAHGKIYAVAGITTDITKRKHVEAALREREQQLRLALQSSGAGVWTWDIATGSLDWSPELFQLFGLDPASGKASFETWRTIMHPADRQLAEERIAIAMRDQVQLRNEYRIVRPTGEERWILALGETTCDAGGKPSHMMGLCLDITDRKQAEAARRQRLEDELHLSEQEFRSLAESMPQIVWATRPDGWNIYFNQQWVDYTGMTLEESYGHGWNTPFHPDDKQPAWEAWQRATQHNERYSLECRLRRHDGVYRWWLIRGEPMRGANGEILKWFGTCTDIEELKNSEAVLEQRVAERTAALQRSEALYRGIGESIDYGVWVCETDGRNTYASPSFLKMVGITQEQCSNFGWGNVLHPDDAPRTIAAWQECVRTGGNWDIEHRFRGADGQWHHVLARGVPVKNDKGEIICWAGINLDIGRLKQAEEQIKAALAEKEVLLKEIHHRVKNNLQVISSLVSLQADSLADDRLRAVFGDVRDRVRTMALVHEKLYQTGDLARLNFADYAASLLHYLWRAHGAAAGNVQLKLAVAPVALPVEAAMQCGLILNELASNALKHAFPNGRAGAVIVAVDHDPATGTVCLRVGDNGVGLPAGLDWRNAPSLGLRLVQMLAGQLHGTVETGPGPGTEFRVAFAMQAGIRD